ncbi:MAG: signal peptidase I [Chloroflexota bacterium]
MLDSFDNQENSDLSDNGLPESDSPFDPSDSSANSNDQSHWLNEPHDLADTRSEQIENSQPRQPTYTVSSAEPDWSRYELPSLESDSDNFSDEEDAGPSGWKTVWNIVREVGETVILTLIIFLLIQTVIRNFRVVGTSMVGNLHDGQYLIVDKVSYTRFLWDNIGIGGPKRGDVVVFEPPNRPDEDYVKRIIALPGETVEIRNGQIWINGELLEESFEPNVGSYSVAPVTVPEDQIYVLGDNRNNSNDSHNWGPLPIDNVVGRAWLSYWPPQSWGTIPRDAPTDEATLQYFFGQIIPSANAESP